MTCKTRLADLGSFMYFSKQLLSATHLTSKVTAEVVDLTPADKLVMMYMVDRVSHFEGNCYETYTQIALGVAMSDSSVRRALGKLIKHGVVIGTKVSASKGYVYTDVDVDQQYGKEVSANQEERAKPNPMNVKAPVSPSEAFVDLTPNADMGDVVETPVRASESLTEDYSDSHVNRYDGGVLDFGQFDE